MNRHRWGEPDRTEFLTTRACLKCGMLKVTHHESRVPWIEYVNTEGRSVSVTAAPPCPEPAIASPN